MGKNVLLIIFLVSLFGATFSCSTTAIVSKSEAEIASGRLAVTEMIRSTSDTAATLLSQQQKWEAFSQELLSQESTVILNYLDQIPGIKRQLENYYTAINAFIEQISLQLSSFIEENILFNFYIDNPFTLIEGSEDAVTRYFASNYSYMVENWIKNEFQTELAQKALGEWAKVEQSFNIYMKSRSFIFKDKEYTKLEADIPYVVTITLLRQFIRDMSEHEALLRALAPASENSWSLLFAAY